MSLDVHGFRDTRPATWGLTGWGFGARLAVDSFLAAEIQAPGMNCQ